MSVFRRVLTLTQALAITSIVAVAHADDGPTTQEKSQIIAEIASLETSADILGHLVFQKYQEKPADELYQIASKTALAAVSDLCDAKYRVIVFPLRQTGIPSNIISLKSPDDLLAYVIGTAKGLHRVMVGRHYRVDLSSDGKMAHSVLVLHNNCDSLSKQALSKAKYVAETVSHGPTEAHVFLSLLHSMKFRVRTVIGLWEIDRGQINFLAKDLSYRPEKVALKDCRLPNGTSFATTELACRKAGGEVLN